MSDSKNWKQLVIAGLVGAIFTGITQYFLLQSQHSSDLAKAKISAKRELLLGELRERKRAYNQIRVDFVEYYRSKNEEDKQALLVSLNGNLPFFSPRNLTQQKVDSATQSAEIWIEQGNTEKMQESLEEIEESFQNDIERIQKMIDQL